MKLKQWNLSFLRREIQLRSLLKKRKNEQAQNFLYQSRRQHQYFTIVSLIQKLAVKKYNLFVKSKPKIANFNSSLTPPKYKVKKIKKIECKTKTFFVKFLPKASQQWNLKDGDRGHTIIQEVAERWSMTAEKQLQENLARSNFSRKRRYY